MRWIKWLNTIKILNTEKKIMHKMNVQQERILNPTDTSYHGIKVHKAEHVNIE